MNKKEERPSYQNQAVLVLILGLIISIIVPSFAMEGPLPTIGNQGRLTGTKDNQEALEALIDQFEAYGFKSHRQSFEVLVPTFVEQPEFLVGDKVLTLYEDYTVFTGAPGGGIDFRGDLLIAGSNWLNYPKEAIQGRIVVIESSFLQVAWLKILQEQGARGVFFCTNTNPYASAANEVYQKFSNPGLRSGDQLFVGFISGAQYKALKTQAVEDLVPNVTLKVNLAYPKVTSQNAILTLGDDFGTRQIVISANFDGLGVGPGGQVFESGVTHGSGVLAALQLARQAFETGFIERAKAAKTRLVIILFNGQHQDLQGLQHFLKNPSFPLETSRWIHLEALGISAALPVEAMGDRLTSGLWMEDLTRVGETSGINLSQARTRKAFMALMNPYQVPAVVLSSTRSDQFPYHTAADTFAAIDQGQIQGLGQYLLAVVKDAVDPPAYGDLLSPATKGTSIGLLGLLLVVWFMPPLRRIRWLQEISRLLVFLGTLTLILTFMVNIPQDTDIQWTGYGLVSNFSLYTTLEKTLDSLRTFASFEIPLGEASAMTFKLLLGTLVFSYCMAYLWSFIETRLQPKYLGSMGTLLASAVPDVFVALLLLLGYTQAVMRFPIIGENPAIRGYWLPMLTLSVLPTLYLTRMATVAVYAELKRTYMSGSYALGYNSWQLFFREMQPPIISKMLDSMPAVLAMTLSNMIVVEYLFNYNGIGYFLLYLYKREDVKRFVPLGLALALGYLSISYLAKRLSRHINPKLDRGRP